MDTLAFVFCALAAVFACVRRLPHPAFALFAVAGDEDMKIAVPGGHTGRTVKPEEASAESEAIAYMRQKSSGNIGRARELGEKLSEILCVKAQEYSADAELKDDRSRVHHRLLLFSYVINRVIAELSPNSILAQTALNVFYNDLDDKSAEVALHLKDMASLSLYILCERSGGVSGDEIGGVYARLCGAEDDAALIAQGEALYREYYELCESLQRQAGYIEA